MNDIKEPESIRHYVCITENTDMHLMRVLEITADLDTAKRVCVGHIYEVAEGENDPDLKIECSMWKDEIGGIAITYQLRGEKTDSIVYKVRILFFERDYKDIMEKLRHLSETTVTPIVTTTQKDNPIKKFQDICNETFKSDITAYEGLIAPPHPPNEYTEYNYKYLITIMRDDKLIPRLKAEAFKWGFPYMIMTTGVTSADPTTVIYGIAAYMSKDEDQVVFITTYNNPKQRAFGTTRYIEISAKDLCSRVKIKCVGMIEGEL